MKQIILSNDICVAAPNLRVIQIEADVVNKPTSDSLWQLIENESERLVKSMQISDIALRPAIAATRKAYKALGKEPNRYRPSAEALNRRVLQGKGLYRINALVDIINLISLNTGYSIGGFDADCIIGETLTLGVGRSEEVFHAIGRGVLNIENLPIYRDEVGGIGTPTSDTERTKLTEDTKRLLMTVNVYGTAIDDDEFIDYSVSLLKQFADAKNVEVRTITQ